MLDMLTTGNEQMFHFGASQCEFKKYVRFDPFKLDDSWDMADKSLLPELADIAGKHVQDFIDVLKQFNGDS